MVVLLIVKVVVFKVFYFRWFYLLELDSFFGSLGKFLFMYLLERWRICEFVIGSYDFSFEEV